MQYQVQIIKSKRKNIGLQIKSNGQVILRTPLWISNREVERFLREHEEWIESHLEKIRQKEQLYSQIPVLTEEEIKELIRQAHKIIPERVAYYAPLVGVSYGRITIRCQKTRWGSCSAKGNLNFNYLLMLSPQEVLDSVVVHELCHRKEMNHSERFYREVYRVYPEYDRWHKWLRANGSMLMRKVEM